MKTLQKLRTGREHWGLVVQEEKDVTSPVSPVIPGQSILWKVNSLVTKRYTLYNCKYFPLTSVKIFRQVPRTPRKGHVKTEPCSVFSDSVSWSVPQSDSNPCFIQNQLLLLSGPWKFPEGPSVYCCVLLSSNNSHLPALSSWSHSSTTSLRSVSLSFAI